MRDELFVELNKAMDSNPDLSVYDVLKYVTEKYYRNRLMIEKKIEKYGSYYEPYYEVIEQYKLSNSDVLKALKLYNDRQ